MNGDTCYIGYYFGKNQYIKTDTAIADAKGNLTFQGREVLQGGVYLLVMPKQYIEFLVGEQNIILETDSADPVTHMKVKLSPENEIFYGYQKFTYEKGRAIDSLRKLVKNEKNKDKEKAIRAQMEKLDKEVVDYRKKMMTDHPTSLSAKLIKAAVDVEVPDPPKDKDGKIIDSSWSYYYYKNHYFDNIDFSDDRLVRTPFFHSKIEKYFKNLVLQMPDSINKDADRVIAKANASKEAFKYVTWLIFNTYESSQIMGMDAVTVYLSENYYLNGKAFWADTATLRKMRERVEILKPLLLGKPAPRIYLTDSNIKTIPLYDVSAKYTVAIFWDSDCWHCQQEMPKLKAWFDKQKPGRFAVYAATIERKPEKWKKYIREHKFDTFINVWDGHTITDFKHVYDVYSTPVLYLFDKDKKIIAKRLTSEQIDEFIEKYEKNKAHEEEMKNKK